MVRIATFGLSGDPVILTLSLQFVLLCAVGAFFGRVVPGQRGLVGIAAVGPIAFLVVEALSTDGGGLGMVVRALCGSVGLGVSFGFGWRFARLSESEKRKRGDA